MRLNIILPLLLLCLSACGFTPVYGDKAVSTELSNITVRPIPERIGQILRNNLLDRGFGTSSQTNKIDLIVENLRYSEVDLGIASDNTSTRRQLTVMGTLQLTDKDTIIMSRSVVARTSYNVLLSQYGTNASRDSALNLALNDLARQIETHSLLTIKGRP